MYKLIVQGFVHFHTSVVLPGRLMRMVLKHSEPDISNSCFRPDDVIQKLTIQVQKVTAPNEVTWSWNVHYSTVWS